MNQEHAIVALTRLPVSRSLSPGNYGGPILINSGGLRPGGSGMGFVLRDGHRIQKIVGDRYDIVGFDPRGVNNTLPSASCFPSSEDLARARLGIWVNRQLDRLLDIPMRLESTRLE